jgi:hypothetical protein
MAGSKAEGTRVENVRRDGFISGLEWGKAQRLAGLMSMPVSKLRTTQEELRPEGLGIEHRCCWRDGFVSGALAGLDLDQTVTFTLTRGVPNAV